MLGFVLASHASLSSIGSTYREATVSARREQSFKFPPPFPHALIIGLTFPQLTSPFQGSHQCIQCL
jgi:hypothetical protein